MHGYEVSLLESRDDNVVPSEPNQKSHSRIFPWHPLACLLAEGKLYHFYYAMVDRDISGRRMSREYIDEHMPANLRYIIHNQMWVADRDPLPWLSRYLPEFDQPAQLPEFPGWTVLTK